MGAFLVESGLYLSILIYLLGLVFIFSPAIAFISHLLLFLHALAFICWSLLLLASLCSPLLFWARAVVFSMVNTSCWSCGSLLAPRLVSRRYSVSPGSAPMPVCRYNVLLGVPLSRTSVPTSTISPRSRHRGTLYLPVIALAPRGEGGMVASAEEADSSASSASSDRPSAVLPNVRPPRGLLA